MISIQPTEVTHYEVKESLKFSFQPRFPLLSHRTMVGGLLQKASATEIAHFRAPDFWKSASILPREEFHKYYLGYFCLIHGSFSSSPALFKGISPGTVTALCGRDPQPKKLQAVNPHLLTRSHFRDYTSSTCTCYHGFQEKNVHSIHHRLPNCSQEAQELLMYQ